MPDIGVALLYFAVFLFSTTLHEAAHAWAALRGGDPTAYHGGQVSLDPWPHVRREPFGMVVLPLISVLIAGWPLGFASAPYDPTWAERHPRRAAWMALAGPASNFALVLLAGGLLRVGALAGVFTAPESITFGALAAADLAHWETIGRVLSVVFSLNLLLTAFNLLPLPPLDGSAVLALGLAPETARRYQGFLRGTPMLGWIGLYAAWQLFDVVFDPIFTGAASLLYPGVTYG
ncbi:site-2 protease family protein [Roseisolibacter agri]|uniref:Peptidase M50 n=1 Tax=Roseisolibacter agri TaxID=2014610 RepID=A0AA37V311_9BACT|nr:site-2 protease family protein [Roseisolibacter agri]GLC25947.1 peptidase M50 [Roseisolibacter agri]